MSIFDVAGDLFGKGMDFAETVARQAGDFASTAGLKAQILDKNLEYDRLMKELGSSVYETLKEYPEIVEANKGLFVRIAGVVEARQNLEDKLAEVEAAADASRPIDVDPVEPDAYEPAGESPAAADHEARETAAKTYGYRSATVAGTQEGNE